MALLEELAAGVLVKGLLPAGSVTIISTKRHGSIGIELVYQDAGGNLGSELLYSDSVANLEIVPAGLPWSFDADGGLFRLTSEAYRIRLAYLFDPLIAVHTSLIEPLPHQITAVYETMLGKQPLRYLLADDPGAGKTIMAGLLIKELMIRGDLRRCLIVAPVCRPRPVDAPIASRRQFLYALRAELPTALKNLQRGTIAPVDLAQASIGPGMAIYSRYSKVVESDGTPLRVHTALQLINRALDEALAEQEGEYDVETRWAIAWFEQYAMNAGEYGIAETLSKAKNTSVQSLVDAGFLEAKAGKVRLLRREELAEGWNPRTSRLTAWEVMQRMIHALLNRNGEIGAGDILRQASSQGEIARDLAYRLYTVCERKGWAQQALAYNSLVTSWSEISRLAHRLAGDGNVQQATLLG